MWSDLDLKRLAAEARLDFFTALGQLGGGHYGACLSVIDLLTYLRDPRTREVMYAEVLIQGILSGRTVDMDEIEMSFKNKKMAETIRQYLSKAGCGTGKK